MLPRVPKLKFNLPMMKYKLGDEKRGILRRFGAWKRQLGGL